MPKKRPPVAPAPIAAPLPLDLVALAASPGWSTRRLARDVLAGRGEATVRGWLAGPEAIPPGVRAWLASVVRIEERGDELAIVLRSRPSRRGPEPRTPSASRDGGPAPSRRRRPPAVPSGR